MTSTSRSNNAHIYFWLMGLLNNVSYTIMLAGAKEISDGGTALVYLANILPTLVVKVTSPFWFYRVSYTSRIISGACLFFLSFLIVAYFSTIHVGSNEKTNLELVGISFGSFGSGMGEATLLAYAGKVCGGGCISAYASGTGTSGVFGFLYFVTLRNWVGLSFEQALWIASLLAIAYGMIYVRYLKQYEYYEEVSNSLVDEDILDSNFEGNNRNLNACLAKSSSPMLNVREVNDSSRVHVESVFNEDRDLANISSTEKIQLVLSLWPYMVPLFFVYLAEYAMQSGTWAAIGFPVENEEARDKFYEYAGWFGVLVSRSSGFFVSASRRALWICASVQVVILVFFVYDAISHLWYNWGLLLLCFSVGLFGGFVYVQSFKRVSYDVPPKLKEFALSSCSVADTFGIVTADASALLIQSCLYERNGIDGTTVQCPF